MNLSFFGAAKTVTGSLFLLETEHSTILVDCGMFQGGKAMDEVNYQPFAFDVSKVDAVVLTHAHIDHSGRLPKLIKEGFAGKIVATQATSDLCDIMLKDSAHIQEMEAQWATRKKMRKSEPAVEPLYTQEDAEEVLKLFVSIDFDTKTAVTDNISVNFISSGHMLGSGFAEIFITENGKETKYTFSGDVGNYNQPLLPDPSLLISSDYLILESTYGNRYHDDLQTYRTQLLDIILQTLRRGGNVIIPSFAVGRTQEMLYEINHYKENAMLAEFADVPVFVDSPLAINATEIFKRHYHLSDADTKALLAQGDDPLMFAGLKYSSTTEDSIAINFDTEPKIIISASGMCDAGRIRHHLKNNLWRENSSIVFVGYQAEGSLGRMLLDGAKTVKLFGEDVAVNAKIYDIDAYSGHADLNGLLNVIATMQNRPEKIVLVHGEEDSLINLAAEIKKKFNIRTLIPSYGDILDLSLDKEIIGKWDVEALPTKEEMALSQAAPQPQPVASATLIRGNKDILIAIADLNKKVGNLKQTLSESAHDRIMDYVGIINMILQKENNR